jgi:hypothetical protein
MNRAFQGKNLRVGQHFVDSPAPSEVYRSGNHLPLNRSLNLDTAEMTDESVHEEVAFQLGKTNSSQSQQFFERKPVPVRSLLRNKASSDGTYNVSSPIYQTQPFSVEQLIPKDLTQPGDTDPGRFHKSNWSYPKRVSTTMSSTQSSKIAQSSEKSSPSVPGMFHRKNASSSDNYKGGTTSESLNSRRGCRTRRPRRNRGR